MLGQMKMEHLIPKLTRSDKSSAKREGESSKCLPQETREISNKQSNLTPRGIRERRTKPKVSRRKEILKIRAEINEMGGCSTLKILS